MENEKQDIKLTKVKLNPDSKLAVLQDDFSINDAHPYVRAGDSRVGYVYGKPEVGKSFILHKGDGTLFRTTHVVKIVSESIFMTENSVYKIEKLNEKDI